MQLSVWRLAVVAASLVVVLNAQTAPQPAEWPTYGGDKGWQRYSSLDQINHSNAKDLTMVWSRPGMDPSLQAKFPDVSAPTTSGERRS